MNAETAPHRVRRARGFTLMELLLASLIFVVMIVAVGSVYISTVRGLEQASTQSFVQRAGTRVQEALADHLSSATAFNGGTCGPVGATASYIFQKSVVTRLHPCTFCCLYQFQDSANSDAFPQLYLCSITSLSSTACLTNTSNNLLGGSPEGRNLRISALTFTPVLLVGSANIAVAPALRVTFELRDGVFSAPSVTCVDQPPCWQFQLTATARN